MMDMTFLTNLGAALLMGVVIGLERQYNQHPAGLRTNALVCLGTALFVSLPHLYGHDISPDHIVGQVVTGVGFLGGGVILREGLSVKGMNTAATLWCSAAVGALTAAGFPLYGAVGTLAVVAVHVGLRPVGRWIDSHVRKATDVETSYRVRVVCEHRQEALLRTILTRHIGSHPGLVLHGIASKDVDQSDQAAVTADIFSGSRNDRAMEDLAARINIEPGVAEVRWERA
jgi:putative Mg2+ transporter-C (MgtC) family protein